MASTHHVRNRPSWDARIDGNSPPPYAITNSSTDIESPLASPATYRSSFSTSSHGGGDYGLGHVSHSRHHSRNKSISRRLSAIVTPLKGVGEMVAESVGDGLKSAGLGENNKLKEFHLGPPSRSSRGRDMWVKRLFWVSVVLNLVFAMRGCMGGGGAAAGKRFLGKSKTHQESFSSDAKFASISADSDKAWKDLLGQSKGVIYAKSPGYKKPHRSKIAMFHQLECLAHLRSAVQMLRSPSGTPDHTPLSYTTSCLDYLRNSILCHADSTVEPAAAKYTYHSSSVSRAPAHSHVFSGNGVKRTCASSASLYEVTKCGEGGCKGTPFFINQKNMEKILRKEMGDKIKKADMVAEDEGEDLVIPKEEQKPVVARAPEPIGKPPVDYEVVRRKSPDAPAPPPAKSNAPAPKKPQTKAQPPPSKQTPHIPDPPIWAGGALKSTPLPAKSKGVPAAKGAPAPPPKRTLPVKATAQVPPKAAQQANPLIAPRNEKAAAPAAAPIPKAPSASKKVPQVDTDVYITKQQPEKAVLTPKVDRRADNAGAAGKEKAKTTTGSYFDYLMDKFERETEAEEEASVMRKREAGLEEEEDEMVEVGASGGVRGRGL
ncbi:hypothetical protein K402DRAFT_419196 [Aulographum hederae CBS 113979]|uniref:Uncharacterized protein n=1 Tax=Aulographum hederae CBS 113979 TaxID=1176131 RepID=A0A6G1H6J6_9PEZI|nr:hypothetical protein K402DRAFT_419196 [Aulographum hederae CBS 113979]